MTKKEIYASYGIKFENGKIYNPMFGWIAPMLVNGNAKLGKGVWTFSTLAGNAIYDIVIDNKSYSVKGTCVCNCVGCYAQTGFYKMPSTLKALAIRTLIAQLMPTWLENAIIAQIKAENIKLCRIHASGDFFSAEYVNVWRNIVKACNTCVFWTYTKNASAENAFNDLANINIVKSLIDGIGMNYGHCDYIMKAYEILKASGKKVHVCKCGFDKNQHCVNCKGCSENEYVLFVEHSTSYKAENDSSYAKLAEIVNA